MAGYRDTKIGNKDNRGTPNTYPPRATIPSSYRKVGTEDIYNAYNNLYAQDISQPTRYEEEKTYPKTGSNIHKADKDGKLPLPAFSGCDIVTIFNINGRSYNIYNVSQISIDTNTTLTPIPTLGSKRVRRFTRGHRMIAGTINMLATVAGPIPFMGPNTMYDEMWQTTTPRSWDQKVGTSSGVLIDTIPPFDIIISYMDEYGRMAYEVLYGVALYRESKVVSVNDMLSEIQCSYFALDRDGMAPSQNAHKYGVDFDGVAENVIMYNNITNLMIELDRLKAMKELQPEYMDIALIDNPDLGIRGSKVNLSYDERILNDQIKNYQKTIGNIRSSLEENDYLQNGNYIDGYREYLLNEDLLPNL